MVLKVQANRLPDTALVSSDPVSDGGGRRSLSSL